MRNLLASIIFLYYIPAYALSAPFKLNQWNIGTDLSQALYIFGTGKKDFNASFCAQYKPFYFLSINTSLSHNSVNNQMGKGYLNLQDYHCRGISSKLGFDLSLGLSKVNKKTRIFIGLQGVFTRYSESGRFEIENYWGTHVKPLEMGIRKGLASEIIIGVQFSAKRWLVRPQFYAINIRDAKRISGNDKFITKYKSPFVPGFGYDRMGLNLIVLYSLN